MTDPALPHRSSEDIPPNDRLHIVDSWDAVDRANDRIARQGAAVTTNARGETMMVLEQVLLDDNTFHYRDKATGRVYTAVEARALRVPHKVEYLGGRR